MDKFIIDGLSYLSMIENGAKNLSQDLDRINALNVFPVPDGDTGTNMKMTIDGGVNGGKSLKETHIGEMSKSMARSMVLSARGNSGVILSQFFKGISMGLEGKETVNVKEFAEAMVSGTKKAYKVVQNPTEGTILTVIREAGEKALKLYQDNMTINEYLYNYCCAANESLKNTPELLPVLKKAGVIDSGGAGLLLIVEGMLKACDGEVVDSYVKYENKKEEVKKTFNADSTLSFGYCTEFILQLQNSKVSINEFDVSTITSFLEKIGNSIVAFKDEDIVKVHVHTMDPGKVFSQMKKYGEFISVKVENMDLQNSEHEDYYQGKEIDALSAPELNKKEFKKYAVVAVANGDGIIEAYKEIGVDEIVSGGQTMNASTQDFIDAFEKINAEYIFVYPNNSNIKMAAKVAADTYEKAKVIVIPTKTISQGYSAISMLNFDEEINSIVEDQLSIIDNASTLEVTYSIRDAQIDGVEIKKDDYICIYNDQLLSSSNDRLEAIKQAIDKIEDFSEKQVLMVIVGKDGNMEEVEQLQSYVQGKNSFIEVYPILGNQEVYSYIIGVE